MASGLGVSLMAADGGAQTPPPSASASPFVRPSGKPPSAVAVALAATMRSFDPALSAPELDGIARKIDAMRALGPQLNPKARPLRNAEDLIVQFHVEGV
jgi:hypothetical protein